jgi:fucose 4-O-acetylase-like acetyltransferase
MTERNYSIDILKGIGILMVILGHCLTQPSFENNFIYSFHMPLFFLVSGYFLKKTASGKLFMNDFKRLVVPYLWVSTIICLAFMGYKLHDNSFPLLEKIVYPLLWGSGGSHDQVQVFCSIGAITQMWFLLALLWGRAVLNHIPSGLGGAFLVILVSIAFTIIGRYVIFLPLGINEGLSALLFLFIGQKLRKMEQVEQKKRKLLLIACVPFWIVSFSFFYLGMSGCIYECYPVQVIGAIGGTFVFWQISKYVLKVKWLNKCFIWLGMNSMAILCIHTLESHTGLWKVIGINQQTITVFPVKVAICIILVLLLSKFSYTREMLGIKKLTWK